MKLAVDALLAEMREAGLAASTVQTNEYRLRHFFGLPKNDARPLRWLTARGDELYAAARADRSADTHQAELALAKQLGELAVKRKWLRANPFNGVDPKGRKTHGSTKPRHGIDESRKLWDYCLERVEKDLDQHALLTLAYLILGARASELVRRDVRDLDDNGRQLHIREAKTPTGVRRLLIPDEIREPLLALVDGRPGHAPIFRKEDGAKATRHWAYHHVKRICREAGVADLSPQALRRTQSDLATEAGQSGPAIAQHLGQRSTVVTDRSYRDRAVVTRARNKRVLTVLAGGLGAG
ncbi:MAG: tyrosine-type recombinase/integrase [Kofleriaceae bacterium]